MKAVAFNGSPRKDGNTAYLLNHVLQVLTDQDIETEFVQVGGHLIHGCTACGTCSQKQGRCVLDDDIVNDCIAKMRQADAVLLGSPTYFADVTPEMKALIDRAGFVAKAGDNFLRRKIGAAVVAVRRGGQIHTFDTINHFFLIAEMIVPGSCYWNMGIGRSKGEVAEDEEGVKTMTVLGENIAWLLKTLA